MVNYTLYFALTSLFLFSIWYINSTLIPPPTPPITLRGKAIVLLIAHPDDESMFFSPTLARLTDPPLSNHIKILCLSTGNADGLGQTRRKELESAALKLGVRKREDVLVLDDERFKDGMEETWDVKEIADVLAGAFAPGAVVAIGGEKGRKQKKTATTGTGQGPQSSIDALITFDKDGVSGHPNHVALHHGARVFMANLMRGYSGYACPITLYTLSSINLLRKYSFVLDIISTYFIGILQDMIAGASGKKKISKMQGSSKSSRGDRVLFVSDVGKYWKARDAMVNGHRSQMVWFRWGWISIGRYMVVNDLKRVYLSPS